MESYKLKHDTGIHQLVVMSYLVHCLLSLALFDPLTMHTHKKQSINWKCGFFLYTALHF